MNFRILCACTVAFSVGDLSQAQAAAVDLSSWIAEGTGNWVLQPGNNAVLQTLNDFPTVFHNNIDSQGLQLAGTIEIQTTIDNDYVGFVLGFNAGDFDNPSPDYLLIDWRQSDQVFGCGTSREGLAISRVTGPIIGFGGTGCHTDEVTELARGLTLGGAGWEDNQVYTFELIFTSTIVQVFVDGVLELNLVGSFSNGSFGFYNSSQQEVFYAGIAVDPADPRPVPIPAAAPLMAMALGLGRVFLHRRRKPAKKTA